MHAAVAILVAAALSGCAGGSRSGSDQPGVDAGSGTAQPAQKESINESSEDDVAAALRRGDVSDPQGWARILVGDRPYPSGQPGQDRIRQVLVDHGAKPDDVAKALAVVEP